MDYKNFDEIRRKSGIATFYTESSSRFVLYFSIDNFILKTVKTKSELKENNIPVGTYRDTLRLSKIWKVETSRMDEEELTDPSEYTIKPLDLYGKHVKKFVGWDLHNIRYWMLKFLETYNFPKITNITQEQKDILKDIFIAAINANIPLKLMEDRLNELFDDELKVERVLRTEMNVISNESALDRYKSKGVKKVRWLSTIDNRTSDICKKNNGKIFTIKDAEGRLPAHVSCRSVWVPLIDSE